MFVSEEILGSNSALWMSSDGLLMVFATFNDTLVEELRFPWYGSIGKFSSGAIANKFTINVG